MPFPERHRERFPGKKSKAQKHIQNLYYGMSHILDWVSKICSDIAL